MCLSVFLLGFILPGTLCAARTWLTICFAMFGKFPAIISSNIFSGPLSLFSFWDPYSVNAGVFNVVPEGLLGCLHFFSFYFLYSLLWQWFPPFCPQVHLSILLPQLFCYWFLLEYFNFSNCVIHYLFVYSLFFFYVLGDCINCVVPCIFSILFSSLWNIFTVIVLYSLPSRLPISSSFIFFLWVSTVFFHLFSIPLSFRAFSNLFHLKSSFHRF